MEVKRQRRIATWLLVVFALFFCGNNFFVHTHRLAEGVTVVHSHPFVPGTTHSHSAGSFAAVSAANVALAAVIVAGVLVVRELSRSCCLLLSPYRFDTESGFLWWSRGRSPPVLFA